MCRSVYPVVAERSFVSCSLMMWSWLMLCSATADLSDCAYEDGTDRVFRNVGI
jgi:hypothetical protein